jgi:hypothetical protein
LCTARFNNHKFYVLTKQRIYFLCSDQTENLFIFYASLNKQR